MEAEDEAFLQSNARRLMLLLELQGFENSQITRIFLPSNHNGYIGIIMKNCNWNCPYCSQSKFILVAITLSFNIKVYCQGKKCKRYQKRDGTDSAAYLMNLLENDLVSQTIDIIDKYCDIN